MNTLVVGFISALLSVAATPLNQGASVSKPIRVEHLKPCVDWWGDLERKNRVENEVAWRVTADEVRARGYNLDIKNPHTIADDHGDPEELLAMLDESEHQVAALRDHLKAVLSQALLRLTRSNCSDTSTALVRRLARCCLSVASFWISPFAESL